MIRIAAAVFLIASAVLAGFGLYRDSADADEVLDRALCRIVENSAQSYALPVPFLTKLLFRESGLRPDAVSRSGARGVAQFMPKTAAWLGLADPFDPGQAIPHAASHLSDLRKRFGNLGLAAAAYNAGPTRVSAWLAGKSRLRAESHAYVRYVTGRDVADWRSAGADRPASAVPVTDVAWRGTPSGAAPVPRHGDDRTEGQPGIEIAPTEAGLPPIELGVAEPRDWVEPGQACLQLTAELRKPTPATQLALASNGAPGSREQVRVANAMSRQTTPRRPVRTAPAEARRIRVASALNPAEPRRSATLRARDETRRAGLRRSQARRVADATPRRRRRLAMRGSRYGFRWTGGRS